VPLNLGDQIWPERRGKEAAQLAYKDEATVLYLGGDFPAGSLAG